MERLKQLIAEYRQLLAEEKRLEVKKGELRAAIMNEMDVYQLDRFATPVGTASRAVRYKLHPKKDELLRLLAVEDIFPFANFTTTRVKEVLVPKYGREKLLPLFDTEKIVYLQVTGVKGKAQEKEAGEPE